MTDVMAGRLNPMPEKESFVASRLVAVSSAFGIDWLRRGATPLQRLWQRDDAYATSELLLLGEGVLQAERASPRWLAARVSNIKSRSTEQRQGDSFEVVALGMLGSSTQIAKPAREAQPGFDVVVTLANSAKVYISVKNHHDSRREEKFWSHSEAFLADTLKSVNSMRLNGFGIIASSSDFVDDRQWQELSDLRRSLIRAYANRSSIASLQGSTWKVERLSVARSLGDLAPSPLSYKVLVHTGAHKNDHMNLTNNINKAISNFEQHAASTNGPYNYRCVLLRIPQSSSMEQCEAWVDEYLRDYPDTTIDAIVLYQATVAQADLGDPAGIMHCFKLLGHRNFNGFLGPENTRASLRIQPIIGGVTEDAPVIRLLTPQGPRAASGYLFQRGDVYHVAQPSADGSISGEMRHVAPDFRTHSVFNVNGSSMVISGKYPASDRLSVFA